ncbi:MULTISPECIES: DUF3500 domain-containing protein [unclassified Rhodococcus (in: high G+C Gram-positive bacteria)]|uniref:DUF3500 domain-containing protein n=1 Tax=unclassified Rhodococcus (in: high G+C Gram-positive bacteria) TaxID=192944 RepID=UPI0006F81F98|nr:MULTISPECIES: DUF3500 domain-containing protein [unclassified Rhodococcus (in: high G+C Gram-positive bacteria)]KQU28541.1 hypothetical protein ASG69_11130 [Rhodococcus sp. Leaf225]KQU47543.1 hypothetical protein ASH03_21850 [Rhodococcus sp. Leaf258]
MPDEYPNAFEAPLTASRLVFTAIGLSDTFTAEQRSAAVIPDFEDPRRTDWDIIPKPDRTGVSMHQLDRHQKVLAWDLVRMCLPLRAFTKVLAITQLETVLRDYEHDLLGPALQAWRTPDSYFLTVFGRPGFEDTWSLRFLGHHVCVNITVVRERWVIATPMALGAQPVLYDGVLQPLRDDEGLAFDLLSELTDAQRSTAVIHSVAPADFVTRQVPHVGDVEYGDLYDLGMLQYRITDADREATKFERARPRGLRETEMTAAQRDILRSLLWCYLDRLPEESRQASETWMENLATDDVHFAWAGATVRGQAHYFRIQTPRFLVEAVNSVNSGNHLHTVLRDLDNDFGKTMLDQPEFDRSVLREHLTTRTTSSVPHSRPTTSLTTTSEETRP